MASVQSSLRPRRKEALWKRKEITHHDDQGAAVSNAQVGLRPAEWRARPGIE